jgi:hypothetical protein
VAKVNIDLMQDDVPQPSEVVKRLSLSMVSFCVGDQMPIVLKEENPTYISSLDKRRRRYTVHWTRA